MHMAAVSSAQYQLQIWAFVLVLRPQPAAASSCGLTCGLTTSWPTQPAQPGLDQIVLASLVPHTIPCVYSRQGDLVFWSPSRALGNVSTDGSSAPTETAVTTGERSCWR